MLVVKDESGEETVVKHPDGSITTGRLNWNSKGPLLTLPDNSRKQHDNGYCFRVYHKIVLDPKGNSIRMKLNAPVDLKLKPDLLVKRTYAPRMTQTDVVIYPPATEGWYGRMILGTEYFNYSIQTSCKGTNEKEVYWLSIFDDDGVVYESYPVKYYEVETVSLTEDLQYRQEIFKTKLSKNVDSIRKHYLSILDDPPPPFDDVLRLVQGTPNVIPQLGKTLGETISSIVPSWIENSTRQELITFLSWIVSKKIPKEDRIALFEKLTIMVTLRILLGIHEYRRIMNEQLLPYVRIINAELQNQGYMAERDEVDARITAKLPSQYLSPVVPEALSELNEKGEIITRIPDSIKQNTMNIAPTDMRFLLYWGGLKLEVMPILPTIGLKELIYIGSAHQWPHIHTVWSGYLEERNARFNSMYFPISSIEKIKKANQGFLEVDMYVRNDNYSLYKNGKWHFPENKFLKSIKRPVKIKDFDKSFLTDLSTSYEMITEKEAYILDISQNMPFISNLEVGRIESVYSISNTDYVSTLNSLHKRKVIKFQYTATNIHYIGLMVTLKGDRLNVLPITYSLLKYTPMSSARIIQNGNLVIMLIRLPYYLLDNLLNLLRKHKDSGVIMDFSEITKLRIYRNNLFTRLYMHERVWDDSIKSIESQKRS